MLTKTITLTHEQANLIECYILLTTNHRKKEAEAWDSLAKDVNEDGTPMFPAAAKNAEFYRGLEDSLTEIRHIIESARIEETEATA